MGFIQLRPVINITPAIFRNKLTTLLVFEQSSLARNGQLEEFIYIFVKYECKYFTLLGIKLQTIYHGSLWNL